ncbi:nuclear transport factor 2 family protein [Gramella sp. GC03-9]|uniref:Nuclear transport factor 2 family protein n=1 Tax=Christiangramia oceanisediminis TaxID=2920386 RepID=A0A9X2I450_9FLAO|nr:nuclear transport factor 2 family protein [Gramella oceanisediminis]MCP9199495.1 nuclear transport factor 2 family protein [Gramella oceanisediminis]
MKKSIFISILLSGLFFLPALNAQVKNTEKNIKAVERQVNKTLGTWHKAAASANFDEYFEQMTEDAVFIGTDATENWNLRQFKKFAKPYFDSGKAWDFKTLERNVYIHENMGMAWFDELLETHMGICRGSGVVTKENGKWKIHHYVLSITIPNENVEEVTEMKKMFDEAYMSKLKKN